MTADTLRSRTSKDLAQLAKEKGVQGWHSMRKEQLVKALLLTAKRNARKKAAQNSNSRNGKTGNSKSAALKNGSAKASTKASSKNGTRVASKNGAKAQPANPAVANRIRKERRKLESIRNIANDGNNTPEKDRVILIVRDPYWIQAYWEITPASIRRAQVALGPSWHHAKPVLRVIENTSVDTKDASEKIGREIEIHGGVNNWFIDVKDHGSAYRVAIGYLTETGKFHLIAKSNEVTTPRPASNEAFDINWADIADDFEKLYSQSCTPNTSSQPSELREVFEEKLRRPMATSLFAQFSGPQGSGSEMKFEVDAQMIVFGRTCPSAQVTLAGEPVRLEQDGTFAVRLPMPDRRQVLPVVANSRDRCEQRTTILAIERNTKELEPMLREPDDDME